MQTHSQPRGRRESRGEEGVFQLRWVVGRAVVGGDGFGMAHSLSMGYLGLKINVLTLLFLVLGKGIREISRKLGSSASCLQVFSSLLIQ